MERKGERREEGEGRRRRQRSMSLAEAKSAAPEPETEEEEEEEEEEDVSSSISSDSSLSESERTKNKKASKKVPNVARRKSAPDSSGYQVQKIDSKKVSECEKSGIFCPVIPEQVRLSIFFGILFLFILG